MWKECAYAASTAGRCQKAAGAQGGQCEEELSGGGAAKNTGSRGNFRVQAAWRQGLGPSICVQARFWMPGDEAATATQAGVAPAGVPALLAFTASA